MKKIHRAAFIVFPRVEELDLAGAWQALGTTQHLSARTYFLTQTVGISTRIVKCAHGLTIKADRCLSTLAKYDVIVVPGGPGIRRIMKDKQLLHEIRKAYEAGRMICSVCTGAFVLAKAGILKRKKATTLYTELDRLSKYGAFPVKERVVVEDNVITGAGVSASVDVGLKIIEIVIGKENAAKVAERIEYRI